MLPIPNVIAAITAPLLLWGSVGSISLHAQETEPQDPRASQLEILPDEGITAYHLGNSHTDSMRNELAGLIWAGGDQQYRFGNRTIPGAPLRIIEGSPGNSFEELAGQSWDFLIMQSYNSTTEAEIQAAIAFTEAARKGNPDVTVLMYSIWPSPENWDSPPLGRREEWNETVVTRLKAEFPGIEAYVIPSSLTIRRVGNAADAGLIPGINSRRALYKDAGHMGTNGAYVIASTIVPMMYGVLPIELPAYMYRRPEGEELLAELPPEAAKEIQLIIMDTLAEYPHDGFETDLWINQGRLEPALLNRPYQAQLFAVSSYGQVQWQIDSATLPAGLQLQGDQIQGTPTEAGRYEIAVQATSGGETISRDIFLEVAEERPLQVATPDFSQTLDVDEYVLTRFQDLGGIGQVTWSVADGELPPGFLFLDSGIMRGTPGKSGKFTATIRATDNHPDEPRTADYELNLTINPPGEDILIARPMEQMIEYKTPFEDHDFSELSFDYEITDDAGQKIAEVAFGWVWSVNERHRDEKPRRSSCGGGEDPRA